VDQHERVGHRGIQFSAIELGELSTGRTLGAVRQVELHEGLRFFERPAREHGTDFDFAFVVVFATHLYTCMSSMCDVDGLISIHVTIKVDRNIVKSAQEHRRERSKAD
jgi:hypothetical protein